MSICKVELGYRCKRPHRLLFCFGEILACWKWFFHFTNINPNKNNLLLWIIFKNKVFLHLGSVRPYVHGIKPTRSVSAKKESLIQVYLFEGYLNDE